VHLDGVHVTIEAGGEENILAAAHALEAMPK
jgi:hypothetical protein